MVLSLCFFFLLLIIIEAASPSRERTFRHIRPAKIQINLHICVFWSESSLGAFWLAKDPKFLYADNEHSDRSVQMRRLMLDAHVRADSEGSVDPLPPNSYSKFHFQVTLFPIPLFNKAILLPVNLCKIAGWVANSVDSDQTPRSAASDQGLHCFFKPVFSNTQSMYSNLIKSSPPPSPSGIILDPPLMSLHVVALFSWPWFWIP